MGNVGSTFTHQWSYRSYRQWVCVHTVHLQILLAVPFQQNLSSHCSLSKAWRENTVSVAPQCVCAHERVCVCVCVFSPLCSPVSWHWCCWTSEELAVDPAALCAATEGWGCYLQPDRHNTGSNSTNTHTRVRGCSTSWVAHIHQRGLQPPWRDAGQSHGWWGRSLWVWLSESRHPETTHDPPPEPEGNKTSSDLWLPDTHE